MHWSTLIAIIPSCRFHAGQAAVCSCREAVPSAGEPLGTYLAIVGGTQAGEYAVDFYIDDEPVGDRQTAVLASESSTLSSTVLLFGALNSSYTTATVGSTVTAVLAGADSCGNLQDLQALLQVRSAACALYKLRWSMMHRLYMARSADCLCSKWSPANGLGTSTARALGDCLPCASG